MTAQTPTPIDLTALHADMQDLQKQFDQCCSTIAKLPLTAGQLIRGTDSWGTLQGFFVRMDIRGGHYDTRAPYLYVELKKCKKDGTPSKVIKGLMNPSRIEIL